MQLTNIPLKLVLPFANSGSKNTIPTASQIGITPGAASLTDGYPPLTRTPIAAGGVPPSGLDMNGILYEATAINRWANAGGGYIFDSTFANDSNVGGYPKGARILRTDGQGYWLNTVENNVTDPESSPVGWVPDFTSGSTAITMTSANVTLTPLQYGKPTIIISGTLTANLNLIFPAIVGEWVVINNTTGAFTITAKTAAGTGYVVKNTSIVICDGTNIINLLTQFGASLPNNGYQKLPSGLIMQWGSCTTPASNAAVDVTLPIAWPTGFLIGVASLSGAATGAGAFGVAPTSGFTLTKISVTQSGTNVQGAWWFALGY